MNEDPLNNQASPAPTPNPASPPSLPPQPLPPAPNATPQQPSPVAPSTPQVGFGSAPNQPPANQAMVGSFGPADKGVGPKTKQNKLLVLVGTIVLFLILVGGGTWLILGRTQTVACTTQSCFNTHFTNCTPATWSTPSNPFGSAKYQTFGKAGNGCKMSFEYASSPNSSWVNKPMTCDFDNSKSLDNSVNAVFSDLGAKKNTYNCTGPFVSVLQSL